MAKAHLYIMTNKHRNLLHIGATIDLEGRVAKQHRGKGGRFESKYRITELVYFEPCADIGVAQERQIAINKLSREAQDKLIGENNPEWRDLSGEVKEGPGFRTQDTEKSSRG